MAENVKYIIEIRDDFSATLKTLDKEVKKAQTSFDKFRGSMKKFGTQAMKTGKKVTTFLTLPIVAAFGLMAKEAINAQETFSKFDTVFDGLGPKAEEAANLLRKSFGISGVAAKTLLSDTGDLLTGFGFSKKSALELSLQVQTLASDLASFTNIEGGATRASQALTKGLLGERESMKLLGIVVNEELIKERLRIKGQHKLKGMQLAQAKAVATLEIAVSQSKNAIGDFARTSDSAANRMKVANARFKDLRIAIGTQLIPIVIKLLEKIVPIIEKSTVWIKNNKDLTLTILKIAGAIAVIGPMLIILGAMAKAFAAIIALGPLVGAAITLAFGPIGIIVVAISALVAGLVFLQKKFQIFNKIADGLKKAFGIFKTISGLGLVEKSFGIIKDKVKGGRPENAGPVENAIPTTQTANFVEKSSVDVGGELTVRAEKGTEITGGRLFDPNLGLNMAGALGGG